MAALATKPRGFRHARFLFDGGELESAEALLAGVSAPLLEWLAATDIETQREHVVRIVDGRVDYPRYANLIRDYRAAGVDSVVHELERRAPRVGEVRLFVDDEALGVRVSAVSIAALRTILTIRRGNEAAP